MTDEARDLVEVDSNLRNVGKLLGGMGFRVAAELIAHAIAFINRQADENARLTLVWSSERPTVAGDYLSRLNGDDETVEWCRFTTEDLADEVHFYEGLQHAGPLVVREPARGEGTTP